MLVVAIFMAAATMPGQTVLVSLYKDRIGEDLGLDLTRVALAYMIGTILAGFPLPLVGRLADRFGLRITVFGVALAFAGALVGTRFVVGFATLTGAFFLIRFLGQGSLGMLAGHTIAMWFERRLGLAHALLAVLGFALGSTLLQQPTAWLVSALGWKDALVVLAGMVLLFTVPSVLFVFRNRPEDIGQHLDGDPKEHDTHDVLHGGSPPPGDPAFTLAQAIRTPAYWILLAPMVTSGFVGTALLFHMGPMMQQGGLEGAPAQVATANMSWPIAFGLCTLIVGPLADRFAPRRLLPFGLALMALGTLTIVAGVRAPVGPSAVVLTMAIGMTIYGASQAVMVGVCNPAIARYFGRTHHGAIRGTVSTAMVMGTGAGPYLVAAIADGAGTREAPDFTLPLVLCACSALPLALALAWLRRPCPPTHTGPGTVSEGTDATPPEN
ncbi:MAG: MFS transporter [Phycisphaerales bacterium]